MTLRRPTNSKTRIQAEQYRFPYHYLVDLERRDFVRNLDWGLDYLTYMQKVLELVRRYIQEDVLDVGCGDGFLLYNLARHTSVLEGRSAVGIDVDGQAIGFARAFTFGLDITFLEQDLGAYDVPHRLITAVETFEHIPDEDLDTFISNIDRLLRPGGHLIVSVPSKVRPVIEKHFRHYDLDMLKGYFPQYALKELYYVTARRSVLYRISATLLANRYVNLNFGPFKKLLLAMHRRYTRDVSADRGAHIITVFHKP